MAATWALVTLCVLALVLLALYRSRPGCPRCGSIAAWQDEDFPQQRSCRNPHCGVTYEVH